MTSLTNRISPDEFASFMRAYQDMVFSTAVRIVANDAQAEDIAQEVFVKAYENFAQLRDHAAAGGWLRTVARNLSLNHVSRYKRRWQLFSELRPRDADDRDEVDPEPAWPDQDDSLDKVSASQRHELIERALRALPPHQRLPLVLFHFEEMSYRDIAHDLGVSLAKIKVDIHRARIALASTLERYGVGVDESARDRGVGRQR